MFQQPPLPLASASASKLSLVLLIHTQQLLCAEYHGHEEPGAMGSAWDTGILAGLEVGFPKYVAFYLRHWVLG